MDAEIETAMYRTVDTRFWSDPKVRDLKPLDKLLFLYLITNPHTHPSGIYYLPQPTIMHETGLTVSHLRYSTDTLSGAGFVKFDRPSEVVWVRNMFRYQGAGEKMRIAAGRQLVILHKSLLIKEFLEYYADLHIPYQYPSDTPSGVGCKQQEQEQDKEKEQKQQQGDAALRSLLGQEGFNGQQIETLLAHPNCTPEQAQIAVTNADILTKQRKLKGTRQGYIYTAIRDGYERLKPKRRMLKGCNLDEILGTEEVAGDG